MGRIGLLSVVKTNVKNWIRLSSIFGLYSLGLLNGEKEVKIVFKNGDSILANSIETAWSLITYYHISQIFRVYTHNEMNELNEMSSYIRQRLEKEFNVDAVKDVHPGANYSFTRTSIGVYCAIRYTKPEFVIETGVAQGVSSFLFLKALQHNDSGRLISIDYPNRDPEGYEYDDIIDHVYTPKEKEPGWLIPGNLRNSWQLIIGKSSEILPALDKCDIFYHDSEHSYNNMMREFEWAYSHVPKGGIISSDDIAWNNAWSDFLKKHKDVDLFLSDSSIAIVIKK